jgi:RNA polymerase sigma-70 factor (ECF subfamily)
MLDDSNIVFNRLAQQVIRRKARLLIGRAGFTNQDREDIEQELALRVLQSLDRFDPEQAQLDVFITTIVERAVAGMLRERLAKKRNGGAVQSLDQVRQKAGDSEDPVDPRLSHEQRTDLASDLAYLLARLPDDLRDLAERLKSQSLSQAARDLGVPRTTLQRQVQRLRRYFEDAALEVFL